MNDPPQYPPVVHPSEDEGPPDPSQVAADDEAIDRVVRGEIHGADERVLRLLAALRDEVLRD